jgi:hypothetical protein
MTLEVKILTSIKKRINESAYKTRNDQGNA